MWFTSGAVLLILTLAGCRGNDSDGPEPQIEVAGAWTVTLGAASSSVGFELSLSERAGVVQGSGTFYRFPASSFPIGIEGTYEEPEVSLAMTLEGRDSSTFRFVGTVSEATMEGILDGGGFTSDNITFERQE